MRIHRTIGAASVFAAALFSTGVAVVPADSTVDAPAGNQITLDWGELAEADAPDEIDGLFDVGGRNLYLRCEGTGSPTVVYLHGAGGASSNAGAIPSLLDDDYRVCVYDRANIGRSDPATGPLSAADAVADLHILLDVAEVPGPYVLLGASGGGDIAFTYAGTHPDDIVGLVLLDSDVPGIRAWEQEYVPEEFWLPEDGWRDDPEQMDEYATWEQLDAAAASVPPIPAILMTLQDYGFPPEAESAVMALARPATGRRRSVRSRRSAHRRLAALHGTGDPRGDRRHRPRRDPPLGDERRVSNPPAHRTRRSGGDHACSAQPQLRDITITRRCIDPLSQLPRASTLSHQLV